MEQTKGPKPAPPPPARQSRMLLVEQMQDEWAAMEARVKELEGINSRQERDLAVFSQDKDAWKDRAIEAEARAHRYALYAVELVTRFGGLKDLADILSKQVQVMIDEGKRVAHRPNPIPGQQQPTLELEPEDQARLEALAEKLGSGRPARDN